MSWVGVAVKAMPYVYGDGFGAAADDSGPGVGRAAVACHCLTLSIAHDISSIVNGGFGECV